MTEFRVWGNVWWCFIFLTFLTYVLKHRQQAHSRWFIIDGADIWKTSSNEAALISCCRNMKDFMERGGFDLLYNYLLHSGSPRWRTSLHCASGSVVLTLLLTSLHLSASWLLARWLKTLSWKEDWLKVRFRGFGWRSAPKRVIWWEINKLRESIALERQGIQQQRSDLPTVPPGGMPVKIQGT